MLHDILIFALPVPSELLGASLSGAHLTDITGGLSDGYHLYRLFGMTRLASLPLVALALIRSLS
jgi:hypothetical protein